MQTMDTTGQRNQGFAHTRTQRRNKKQKRNESSNLMYTKIQAKKIPATNFRRIEDEHAFVL
jgi:hypothetical protein